MTLIAVAGCSGGGHASPPGRSGTLPVPSYSSPPSPPSTPGAAARPAGRGTVCGQITTVTGQSARVVVVRGRTTCPQAIQVFETYHDPTTPAEGAAGLVVIGHWTCQTRRGVTTCQSKAATVQSRPATRAQRRRTSA